MPCPHLLPPGPQFLPELLLRPHPEPLANTCHPLSVTKGPAPLRCPQISASPLPSRPLVQRCLLLYPDPSETSALLPRREIFQNRSVVPKIPSGSPRSDKKRQARSLPPCAPRCPEPGRLRFPPCGIRCSSSSSSLCRGRQKLAKCPSEVTGGYSLPLRGVTECPPQEWPGWVGHRCSKGYPTQELVGFYSSEQGMSSGGAVKECPWLGGVARVTKECPQLARMTKECPRLGGMTKECPQLGRVTKECPQLGGVTKVTKECPPLRGVTKECPQLAGMTKECPQLAGMTKECPQLGRVTKMTKECPRLTGVTKVTKECPQVAAVTKGRSSSGQHLSKSRCAHRGTPRASRLCPAGPKRSGHAKKSRCGSRWLW